jgi:hypothetical protein
MTLDELTKLLQAEPWDGTPWDEDSEIPKEIGLIGLVELRRVTCAGGGGPQGLQSMRTDRGEQVARLALWAANTKGI